ncbi:VPS10 domain-containing receptor SorCS3 [Thelohanellus kitauei]|uniref:VPS10 domain-containing receptor SorCS3 n=1 Tax=Thelohanellus kitauei TaxID=669202 RepID=A0A0C2M985_THEKT|nr:VPS10 domain-containing receptor SorCS3 [Thelohanellus kitauei]
MANFSNFRKYFFIHGNLYTYGWKNESTLCLWMMNKYDRLISLNCDLSVQDTRDDKCPFIINPHIPCFIYANFKVDNDRTLTFTSRDCGKHFFALEFKPKGLQCTLNNCKLKFDLSCADDFITKNFPEKYIIQFGGTLHNRAVEKHQTCLSFDGGENYMILNYEIKNAVILNRRSIIFVTKNMSGKVWFSYNEGQNWYGKSSLLHNLIELIPIELPNHPIMAAVNFNSHENYYIVSQFNFSNLIGVFKLMTERTCQDEDFEIFYAYSRFGKCFQGQEISYLKKKRPAMCFDNRTEVVSIIKQCPCSITDFHWYCIFNYSKPHYQVKDGFCMLNPLSNFTEPRLKCRDDGVPLIEWNGYDS